MKNIILSSVLFLPIPSTIYAECGNDNYHCYNTIIGALAVDSLSTSRDKYSRLTLSGKEIYKAMADYLVIDNFSSILKGKKRLVTKATISYASNIPCAQYTPAFYCRKSVVVDLTTGKSVISNSFSSESGGSIIKWISWGKANSIIVFEDGSKFKYSSGHVERVTQKNKAVGKLGE